MSSDKKCFRKIGCVSSLGMGTWDIGGGFWTPDYSRDRESVEALRRGIELGIKLIDTAEMYGGGHSEELVGVAIKSFDREELFIVTKVWPTNASYDSVLRSARASMNRLGTYIDLYLLHWPSENVPICETIKAFEKLVDDGVIRFYGVSNFNVRQIEDARYCSKKYDVVAVQNRFSLFYRHDEKDVIPYAKREGLLYMAYTPIEKGAVAREEFLRRIGEKYGKTAVQVALNWLISIDPVVPIPKASKIQHVEENAGAMGWRLSREDWEAISNKYRI
ncbi:MAG: aldo/keto reductase [Sulfolobales archaeon]|jgi:diketogulonate reductase-like aldo/keto reductase